MIKKLPNNSSNILANRNDRSIMLSHEFVLQRMLRNNSVWVCLYIRVWKLMYSSALFGFCAPDPSLLSSAHVPLVPKPWPFWGIWWFTWFYSWIVLLPDMFTLVSPQPYSILMIFLVIVILWPVDFHLGATLRTAFLKPSGTCLFIGVEKLQRKELK